MSTGTVGSGISLAGGLTQGIAQYTAGKTRSELLNTNAEIADAQARSTLQAGNENANMALLRNQRVTGQQVSAIGGNNLTQGGTSRIVVASSARNMEMSRLETINNAARKAWGFQVQGESDEYQAELAKQGGVLGALGAFAGAGASFAKSMSMQQPPAQQYDQPDDSFPTGG